MNKIKHYFPIFFFSFFCWKSFLFFIRGVAIHWLRVYIKFLFKKILAITLSEYAQKCFKFYPLPQKKKEKNLLVFLEENKIKIWKVWAKIWGYQEKKRYQPKVFANTVKQKKEINTPPQKKKENFSLLLQFLSWKKS